MAHDRCIRIPGTGPAGRLLAARLLRDGLAVRLRVHGTSMRPSLADGAEVELGPLDSPPRPGDIVLTDLPLKGQRLHRMIRSRPCGAIQTRGDACIRLDPPVPAEAVIGRVRRVRGGTGRWRRCAPRPLSRGLAALLLGVSVIALALGFAPGESSRPERVPAD